VEAIRVSHKCTFGLICSTILHIVEDWTLLSCLGGDLTSGFGEPVK